MKNPPAGVNHAIDPVSHSHVQVSRQLLQTKERCTIRQPCHWQSRPAQLIAKIAVPESRHVFLRPGLLPRRVARMPVQSHNTHDGADRILRGRIPADGMIPFTAVVAGAETDATIVATPAAPDFNTFLRLITGRPSSFLCYSNTE